MNKKVLLGMSGGVDSSVAAVILQEQGYEVIGATMILWENKNCRNKLCSPTETGEAQKSSSVSDAKNICNKLGIEHYVFDAKEEFKECVINNFIESYKQGLTPNPCIECNKYLKFNYFYKKAQELGCEYISTGHYAKTEYSEEYKKVVINKANSGNKDQTYVLYNIQENLVSKILFPLGQFTSKEEIRKIAQERGLITAKKPDSQEICFIPDNDYGGFIEKNIGKQKEGNIVDIEGNVLGKHKGLIHHTIGQRKGLGISHPTPLFVIKLDMERNELVVGDEQDVFSKELTATNMNYLLPEVIRKSSKKDYKEDFLVTDGKDKEICVIKDGMDIEAKIRYSARPAKAKLYIIGEDGINSGKIKIIFNEPQKAITSGQSVAIYIKDTLIGGGKIV